MARCFALTKNLQGDFNGYAFNIDAAVGPGCPNNREDIVLVQYLLSVWKKYKLYKETNPAVLRLFPEYDIKIDGIFGDQTKIYIGLFEMVNPQLKPDGRIDPMETANLTRTKLFQLNLELYFAGGLRVGIPQTRVPFPTILTRSLFR